MFSFLRRRSRDHETINVPQDKSTKLRSTDIPQVSTKECVNYIEVGNPSTKRRRFRVWDEENVRFCRINILASDKPYKPKPPRNKVKLKYRSSGDAGPGYYYVTGSRGYAGAGYSSGGFSYGDGGGCGGGAGGDSGGGGGCGGM